MWRACHVRAPRPATITSTTAAAEARFAMARVRSEGRERARWGSGRISRGQKAAPPRMASIAGASVIATTRPMTTVSASAGPKPRKSGDSATRRAAVPPATVTPATVMIGVKEAVARRAASRRSWPSRILVLSPER